MNTLEFCEEYLEKYTINTDNTIDVDGDVYLLGKLYKMKKLPVKFGKVSGNIDCSQNKLTTLDGCPSYVGGDFWCDWNKLTILEYCPNYVGGDFWCFENNLITLEYCPNYVGGNFECDTTTHHILGNVQGDIYYKNKHRIVI